MTRATSRELIVMKLSELFTNWAEKDSGFTEKKQLWNRNTSRNHKRLLALARALTRKEGVTDVTDLA